MVNVVNAAIGFTIITMTSIAAWIHTNNLVLNGQILSLRQETRQKWQIHEARAVEVAETRARIKAQVAANVAKSAVADRAAGDARPVLRPEMACIDENDPDVIQLKAEAERHEARIKQLREAAGSASAPREVVTNLDDSITINKKTTTPRRALLDGLLNSKRTKGELYQFTYRLPKKTSVPLLGKYWFPEMDRSCNVDNARVVGEDPMIEYGDTSSCKVVDLVWQRQMDNRCTVIHEQPCQWHNFKYDDARQDETTGASFSFSVRLGPDGKAFIPKKLPAFSGYPGIGWRDVFLPTFLEKKTEIVAALIDLIGTAESTRFSDALGGEPMVVMNTNHGHAGMVINFFCQLRAEGIPTPRHVIFTTHSKTRDKLTALGLTAFYHEGLGKYPDKASVAYGDIDFGKQMNMKQFCVYITLLTGHDVLFQDVDVFWYKDPVPALQAQSAYHHIQLMDDGARTFRFSPLFANSGFFYIKNHPTSIRFWDMLTMTMAFGQTGNQEVLNPIMEYYTKRRELKPRILPQQRYMSGMHISEKGKSSLFAENVTEVVHFCWTHNFDSKYTKMSKFGMLQVSGECLRNIDVCKFGSDGTKVFETGSTPSSVHAKRATAGWYDRCPSL